MTKVDIIIKCSDGTSEELRDLCLPITCGRAPDCDVMLQDTAVSRYHFSIEEIENSVWINDLNSKNGTFVNSEKIKSKVLKTGDTIQVGNTIIRVRFHKDEEPSLAFATFREIADSKDINMALKRTFKWLERHLSLISALIVFKGKDTETLIKWKISDEDFAAGKKEIKKGVSSINSKQGTITIPFKLKERKLGGFHFRVKEINSEKLKYIESLSSVLLLKLINTDIEKVLKKERTTKKELTKFVPYGITPDMIMEGIPTEPAEREVSILFCDIVNFTSICEKITLKDITELLEQYFQIVSESVSKHSGWVNKFMGDGAMCVFGAPLPLENHPLMAVECGNDLLGRIKDLRKYPYTDLNLRIGINSGKCIVGKIGKGDYSEYTVIGDTVNVASRLQEIANPGTILIGERTHDKVKTKVNTKYTGTLSLKGKKLKTRMYQILI